MSKLGETREMYEIRTCGRCMCRCWDHDGCARLEHMIRSGEISSSDYDPEDCKADSPACDWARYVGVDFGDSDKLTNIIAAKAVWKELEDVTVDENNVNDVPFFDPYLGVFEAGDTYPEDIWYEIEDVFRVSVAWLMGMADNPDGSNN